MNETHKGTKKYLMKTWNAIYLFSGNNLLAKQFGSMKNKFLCNIAKRKVMKTHSRLLKLGKLRGNNFSFFRIYILIFIVNEYRKISRFEQILRRI